MNKFISMIALWALTMLVGILTMIHGWGLEPKSWWWIIGAGIFVRFMLAMMETVAKSE